MQIYQHWLSAIKTSGIDPRHVSPVEIDNKLQRPLQKFNFTTPRLEFQDDNHDWNDAGEFRATKLQNRQTKRYKRHAV